MFKMAVFWFTQRQHSAGQRPKVTGGERACEAPGLYLFIWRAGSSLQRVGPPFPGQGSKPGPLHWEHSLSHWSTRGVPGRGQQQQLHQTLTGWSW